MPEATAWAKRVCLWVRPVFGAPMIWILAWMGEIGWRRDIFTRNDPNIVSGRFFFQKWDPLVVPLIHRKSGIDVMYVSYPGRHSLVLMVAC